MESAPAHDLEQHVVTAAATAIYYPGENCVKITFVPPLDFGFDEEDSEIAFILLQRSPSKKQKVREASPITLTPIIAPPPTDEQIKAWTARLDRLEVLAAENSAAIKPLKCADGFAPNDAMWYADLHRTMAEHHSVCKELGGEHDELRDRHGELRESLNEVHIERRLDKIESHLGDENGFEPG